MDLNDITNKPLSGSVDTANSPETDKAAAVAGLRMLCTMMTSSKRDSLSESQKAVVSGCLRKIGEASPAEKPRAFSECAQDARLREAYLLLAKEDGIPAAIEKSIDDL